MRNIKIWLIHFLHATNKQSNELLLYIFAIRMMRALCRFFFFCWWTFYCYSKSSRCQVKTDLLLCGAIVRNWNLHSHSNSSVAFVDRNAFLSSVDCHGGSNKRAKANETQTHRRQHGTDKTIHGFVFIVCDLIIIYYFHRCISHWLSFKFGRMCKINRFAF